MRYTKVNVETLAYELGPNVVTSRALEDRLAPLYQGLRIQPGQLEALTGIRERRFWDAGAKPSEGALKAAKRALAASRVAPRDLGCVIFASVCRDNLEPATACAVASGLGLSGDVVVQDISNACLGVLSGILDVANRIELGQIKAGLVVACESAREITDIMIGRLLEKPSMETFRTSLATMTGGSGAVAVVLTAEDVALGHRLMGGVVRAAPEHHRICRWGPDTGLPPSAPMVMETDAVAVLKNGVVLGQDTWRAFLSELDWSPARIDRVFCHQVTAGHSAAILQAFGVAKEKDFSTVEFLGNMGTAALPTGLAIGAERGVVKGGDRVALLGIGSGLNCLMLGVEW
ncbi:MAG TPA: 3-oxoacyl-ACP synthase III [Planctomycetota bacterium]|nr:3-oxoacyl-ACP synthase III [Planctomycetota bacterium]